MRPRRGRAAIDFASGHCSRLIQPPDVESFHPFVAECEIGKAILDRFREVGEDARDHLNLIFPVYLKLMTRFPSFQPEGVGVELLH
jgi:hypothetical protein